MERGGKDTEPKKQVGKHSGCEHEEGRVMMNFRPVMGGGEVTAQMCQPEPPSPGEWKAQPPAWGQRGGGRASEAGVSAHPAGRTGEGAGRGSSPRSARSPGHPSSYTRFQAAPGPPPTPSPP
ncbi:unnamed protein product [Rangifer tarandus platyrhynchus]|uniref:Uncharacterized protein n=1 Tax=Rangifer tarandus platyrhynchus TaxID=3082113 RepID=A0AC59YBX1_RANTA